MKKKPERPYAAALRYEVGTDAAPKVTAKGAGLVAERILEIARQHNVPLHHDPDLVAVLARLDLNTPIPEALYRAVAEVLAFVYRLRLSTERRG